MEDDDVPQLSAETFAALQQFYKEQEDKETLLKNIQNGLLINNTTENVVDINFDEDWQLSQFWYDEETVDKLVKIACKTLETKEVDKLTEENDGKKKSIALISCPTLYKKLKAALPQAEVSLLEYDRRFAAYGSDFILYDYKQPLSIPREKSSHYDLVIADPPFLSEECLTKTAVTMKYLAKKHMILCTGDVMSELAGRLLDLKKSKFEPKHKNNLANEFSCFTNYNIDSLLE